MTPISGGAAIRPWRLMGETLRLVITTEIMAVPLGILLAFLLFRTDVPGRKFWLVVLALVACIPMPLYAAGWLGGFGNLGRSQAIGTEPILVGRFGAAFVHAAASLAWIIWIVGIGLRLVEPELEESARLDLPPWRVAWSVTLRRSLAAILGAMLAVAVLTAGDMTVTDLLAIRTYAEEAYLQFGIGNGPGAAAATALPPLAILGVCLFLGSRWVVHSQPTRLLSTATHAAPWHLGKWRIPAGVGVAIVLGMFLGLPLYALIWRAGRVRGDAGLGILPHWSIAGLAGTLRSAVIEVIGPFLRRPLESPLGGSLFLGAAGATGAVALAWALAWIGRKSPAWRSITIASACVALAVPGPVAGMAMLLAYHRVPWLYDSSAILVLTFIVRTWTYALLVLWPAVRSVPDALLEAAELDGEGPLRRAWLIGLPLTRGAIGLAWGVAFLVALGELPAAALIMPPGISTLTSRIWDLLHVGVESRLAGIALVTLGVFAIVGTIVSAGFYWFFRREARE
jgi:iron(III) transport system permease protein